MNKKIAAYVVIGLSLFILSIGVSYLAFSGGSKSTGLVSKVLPTPTPVKVSRRPTVDPALPKTEVCPMNGLKYTTLEKEKWEKLWPLAVMIENSPDSRPQSGLSVADIVYEAVAEGGVSRFMAIYHCGLAAGGIRVAPVRSARIYYTKLVPEYDALYNHVGGAGNCDDPTVDERAKALCFIRLNKIKDLDQFGLDFKACHRLTNRLDKEVAYEHTMACFTDELYKVAIDKRKFTAWNPKKFTPWKFGESDQSKGAIGNIKFDFWKNKPQFTVGWKYDVATNTYLRSTAGEQQIDLDTEEKIAAKNIVIQFVKETGPLDEHNHMYYEVLGTGKMLLFQNGEAIEGTWSKASFASRTKFMDSTKKEIEFTPGQIWIELVPAANKIEYN